MYQAQRITGEHKVEPTPAMEIGSALHAGLIEPDKFSNYISDDLFLTLGSRRTNAYKDAVDRFKAEHPEKTIIKDEDFNSILKVLNEVRKSDICNELLSGGEAEMSYYWRNKETGLVCKCRPDYVKIGKRSYITEIKKCYDASTFEKIIVNRRYHIQAVQCLEGIQAVTQCDPENLVFIFMIVETEFPFGIRLMMLKPSDLIYAQKQRLSDMEKLKKCFDTNKFPKYDTKNWGVLDIEVANLPAWAFYDLEVGNEG